MVTIRVTKDTSDAEVVNEAAPEKDTISRVTDILHDVLDIMGLGHRVFKESSELASTKTVQEIGRESSTRATEIRRLRKKPAA
jgi:hypothetical protein